jgi:hypothetical protein
MVGRTCPYCRFALEQGVSVIACGVCKAVHHDDCWDENGGCAVALCAGGPSFAAAQQQEPPPATPASPAAPQPPPLPAVVAPDPSEAPTQKAARPPSTPAPPPPPGAPLPPARPSRSRWVPLIAAAIILLGGATAAAIVLTKQDKGASDTASVSASETTPASAEFEEDEFNEEGEFEEEEGGFEEEEFEEEEEPPPSPAQLAQGQIQHALRAHFDHLASGDYEDAYYDLTSSEGEAIGGESAWVAAQEEDQLQSFNLAVETSLNDPHSARATIVNFRTHALATGCNEWSGSWEMSKVYGEWLISSAELEKESC